MTKTLPMSSGTMIWKELSWKAWFLEGEAGAANARMDTGLCRYFGHEGP